MTVDLPTWNVSNSEELATAIAEAKSGDTICLAAGDYNLADLTKSRTTGASTLIIDKSINLVGAVDENNNPATVIKGNNDFNDDAINIVGGVDVTIENIYFTEFGGNMTNNNVILAGSTNQAFTGTLNVKNCNIDKFGKNGITVKGGTANITNVNIDVAGPAENRAPNGIQIDMNAVATIDQTTVRNSDSSSKEWDATGILTLRGGKTTATNVTLENCEQAFTVTGLYNGEEYEAGQASIANSKFLNCEIAVSNDTENAINASDNYWGEGDAITNIANQTSGNVTVDTYYADESMQESVALEGTPVANVEQLREAIANAADGNVIFLAAGEYVLDENECFVLDKKLVIRGSGEDTIIKATNSKDYNNGVFTFAGGSEGSVLRDMTISYQSTGAQSAAVYFNGTFTGGSEEKLTQIYNVDFIGGDSLENIGKEIAISSTYSTNGPIGYIDIRECSFKNFAYGMYFCSLNNSTITGCVIDGTKYNAINIAADTNDESSVSENVSIYTNVMTNIFYANYEDEAYSCGIRVGLAASDIVLDRNDIVMLNDKTPVYIEEPAEGSDRALATFKDGETTIRTEIVTVNERSSFRKL